METSQPAHQTGATAPDFLRAPLRESRREPQRKSDPTSLQTYYRPPPLLLSMLTDEKDPGWEVEKDAAASSSRHDFADPVDRLAREADLMLIIARVRRAKEQERSTSRSAVRREPTPNQRGRTRSVSVDRRPPENIFISHEEGQGVSSARAISTANCSPSSGTGRPRPLGDLRARSVGPVTSHSFLTSTGYFLEESAEFFDVLEPGEQDEENVRAFIDVEEPWPAERVLDSRNSGGEGEEEGPAILAVLPGVAPVGGRHPHLSLSTGASAGHDPSPLTTGVEESSSSLGGSKNTPLEASDHYRSVPVSSSHVVSRSAPSLLCSSRTRSSFFSATPPRDVRSFFSHLDEGLASRSVRGLNWLKLSPQQVLDIVIDLATKLTAAVEVVLGEEKNFARHALHSYDVELGDGSLRAALAANPSRFSSCWYRFAASYVQGLAWVTALAAREGGVFSRTVRWILESLPMGLVYGGFEPTVILSAQTTSLRLRLGGLLSWPGVYTFLRWIKAVPSDEGTFHVSWTSPRRNISCFAGAQHTEEGDLELDDELQQSSKTSPATASATQPPFNELFDAIHFFGREVASMRYVAARTEDPLTPRLEYILSGPSASSNTVGFFLLMEDIILPYVTFPFSVVGNIRGHNKHSVCSRRRRREHTGSSRAWQDANTRCKDKKSAASFGGRRREGVGGGCGGRGEGGGGEEGEEGGKELETCNELWDGCNEL